MKGAENGIEKTPAMEYFTVGENKWKNAESWPVKETVPRTYYLDGEEDNLSSGNGSFCGKGRLALTLSEKNGSDTYCYNPENPAIHIVDMSENELEVPEDYTQEERREDVLTYSTGILEEPLTITGDIYVKLYVSCDCPDTDFVVRIMDVDETGKAIKLADGVLCAKYRNGFEKPEYMEPGEIYEINIRTTKISNTFAEGHQMHLTVTSSAKNFIFPNSNTKDGFDSETRRKAQITLHHGKEHASCMIVREETQS